jgi:DDE superfamily endonuclease
LKSNIDRIRPLLKEALHEKWAQLLPRPGEDMERNIVEAGQIVDCFTTECFRPKGRFSEAKIYYDGNHWIYGLKSEISVTTARPHFYLTSSGHSPASTSDYTIHKRCYSSYLPYLRKTQEEQLLPGTDPRHPYWSVLADKIYTGPASDTPDEIRIVPQKKPTTVAERARNKEISSDRIYVEHFLGRLVQKFDTFRGVYRFDHDNFDTDFVNACLLINEDILVSGLTQDDSKLYQQLLASRVEKHNEEVRKRKHKQELYKANKKRKLEKIQHYVIEKP